MIDPDIDERFCEAFTDPRADAGFDPTCYPEPAGKFAADGAGDTPAGRCRLMFLAVYYRLNRASRELAAMPAGGAEEPVDGRSGRRQVLDRIAWLGRARDHLEDALAPYGFIGEPEMLGAEARRVVFTEPPVRFRPPPGAGPGTHPVSVSIPVPVPVPVPVPAPVREEAGGEETR